MGRERKNTHGATNLVSPMNSGRNVIPMSPIGRGNETESFSPDKTMMKSNTHKIIVPLAPEEPLTTNNNRKVNDLATWKIQNQFDKNEMFSTTIKDSYKDPAKVKNLFLDEEEMDTLKREKKENAKKLQIEIVKKLCGIAKEKFGNFNNMFRAFKKSPGDIITLYEFSEHLRRKNLDTVFPYSDQELIFECYDLKNEGAIPVGTVLKSMTELEAYEAATTEDKLELRNFLKDALEEKRKQKQDSGTQAISNRSNYELSVDTKDNLRKVNSGGAMLTGVFGGNNIEVNEVIEQDRLEAEASIKKKHEGLQSMEVAMGQKTFDIDVSASELNELLNDNLGKKHTKQSHEKFSRYLRMSNLNLNAIPFYDLRNNDLDNLKNKITEIHGQERTSNEKLIPLHEKNEILKKYGSMSLTGNIERYNTVLVKNQSESSLPFDGTTTTSKLHKTKSMNTLKKDLSDISSPIKSLNQKDTTDSLDELYDTYSGTKQAVFYDKNESQHTDFYPQFLDSNAIPRMKDPTAVLVVRPPPSQEASAGGRRSHPQLPMDWTRVGVGSNANYKTEEDIMDRYKTSHKFYYPTLKYEPSMPVSRNLVSDADQGTAQRNDRLSRRRERCEANLDVTNTRIAYESQSEQMMKLRQSQSKNEDMMRYKTVMFLNDMQCFKHQPLQMMSRKPDFTLAEKMWGGDDRPTNTKESRDFASCYEKSYNSNNLKPGAIDKPQYNLTASEGMKQFFA
jgi:hypothetical protein